MRIPQDTSHADPNWLVSLLDGLSAYADSLYTAWRLANEPIDSTEEGSERLGWFGFSQDTRLLMEIRNILHVELEAKTTKPGHKPDIHLIQPPKVVETTPPDDDDATFASMVALLGGAMG